MNKEKFALLRMHARLNYLWNNGEIVAEKDRTGWDISLFLVHGFFVEVIFDRIRNRLMAVEIQQSKHILYSYVKDIDLGSLTNA